MKMQHPVLITLLLIGCAGSGDNPRPPGVGRPAIRVRLANPLFFGSGTMAPANLEVTITSRANVPIRLRRLEIGSPGMAEYTLVPMARDFSEVIAPGEAKTIVVVAAHASARSISTCVRIGDDRQEEVIGNRVPRT